MESISRFSAFYDKSRLAAHCNKLLSIHPRPLSFPAIVRGRSTHPRTMSTLINRSDYLAANRPDAKAAHRAYYAQFVTPAHLRRLAGHAGMVGRIKASQDPHFNDIPLSVWDVLAVPVPAESAILLKECGDYPTLAGAVCILKEAAQQIREGSANA